MLKVRLPDYRKARALEPSGGFCTLLRGSWLMRGHPTTFGLCSPIRSSSAVTVALSATALTSEMMKIGPADSR